MKVAAKTMKMTMMAIFLGLGTIIHQWMPPLLFGVKPDLLLVMMFLAIILFPHRRDVLVMGVASGLISALTTSFPMGQLPSMADKMVSAMAVWLLIRCLSGPMRGWKLVVILGGGTLISGIVFLTVGLLMLHMMAQFGLLMLTVVLPTTVWNTIFGYGVYQAMVMARIPQRCAVK